jgi:Peptidase A4 family
MKKLITRTRSLALVAALAAMAAMCSVSTANAASPAGGAVGVRGAASQTTAASSTPCTINYLSTSCQSTNPAVTVDNYFSGDESSCSYVSAVTWGDGQSTTNVLYTDPGDGYDLLGTHTYAGAGTYAISVTLEATAGDCTANGFTAQFTLSPPPLPPSGSTVIKNYAGYSIGPLAGTDLSVQANWIVPKVDCSGAPGKNYTGRAAVWVGMWGPKWLWQAGTNSQCTKKSTHYYAWYELFPNGSHTLTGISVQAGDSIFAQVENAGVDNGRLRLWYDVTDQSSGVQQNGFVDAPKGVSLSDIMGQAGPEVESLHGNLAKFSPITISNIEVGAAFSSTANVTEYEMGEQACVLVCVNDLLATPGPLSNSSFTVTWKKYTL